MAKVVVLDNDIENAQKLSDRLELENYFKVIKIEENGYEGLKFIKEHRGIIDLLIIDLMLPIYDGIKVLSEINQACPNKVKNVIVTSKIYTPESIHLLNKEYVSYTLLKPYSLDTIVETIYSVIESKNLLNTGNNKRIFDKILADDEEQEITNEKYLFKLKVEREVGKILRDLGMPANIKGYTYIKAAIIDLFYNTHLIGQVSKMIYPLIAKRYNSTSSRVERAMRHAIEVSWRRGNIDTINEIFGYTVDFDRGKPTNSEYINSIADHLKIRLDIAVLGDLIKI